MHKEILHDDVSMLDWYCEFRMMKRKVLVATATYDAKRESIVCSTPRFSFIGVYNFTLRGRRNGLQYVFQDFSQKSAFW